MKKTIIALIAVLILGVGAYYSLQNKDKNSTLKVEETDFSVTDTSQITRFFIARKNGQSFHFKKQNNGDWQVNDSWKANPVMVKMLLGTFSEMRVKSIVPKGMRNGVITTLAGQGVKVELYNKEGMMKTFYVGDYTADEKGTYFIMDGSEQPYIVHIPRFQGYLTGRFLVSKKDFLDQAIFSSRRDDIKSISVEYPSENEKSISIIDGQINDVQNIDTLKLKQYLLHYSKIYSESIIAVETERQIEYTDSIKSLTPKCIISLEDKFPTLSNKIHLYDVNNKEKMLGYMPSKEQFVWVQYYVLKRIMVDKSYFEKTVLDL